MNIILFGFKGCGKTYFGKLLSSHLKLPFIDTDDLLGNVRELYKSLGETAFRSLETKIILQLPKARAVIAVGGGAVLAPENVGHLQTIGQLVYLKASFETIQKRMQGIPAFVNAGASLHQIYQHRIPVYEAIPARWVDVDKHDVLQEILHGL